MKNQQFFKEALCLEDETTVINSNYSLFLLLPESTNLSLLTRWIFFWNHLLSLKDPCVNCGDTNIDILKENKPTKNYKGCIASNGFVINEAIPTRVVDKSSTCLDHFIFQKIKQPEFFVLNQKIFLDHYPIHLKRYYGSVYQKLTKENRDTNFLKSNRKINRKFSHHSCTEI